MPELREFVILQKYEINILKLNIGCQNPTDQQLKNNLVGFRSTIK